MKVTPSKCTSDLCNTFDSLLIKFRNDLLVLMRTLAQGKVVTMEDYDKLLEEKEELDQAVDVSSALKTTTEIGDRDLDELVKVYQSFLRDYEETIRRIATTRERQRVFDPRRVGPSFLHARRLLLLLLVICT